MTILFDPTVGYPTLSAQNPPQLLDMLGRFWSRIYGGRETLQKVLQVRGELSEATYQVFQEALNADRVETTDVYAFKRWTPLPLLKSTELPSLPRYGVEGYSFDGTLKYGVPVGRSLAWEIPAKMAAAGFICDSFANSQIVWQSGIDFQLLTVDGKRVIQFSVDPFLEESFASQNLINGDQELVMWVYGAQYDLEYLYNQWGYVLDEKSLSSEQYRTALYAMFESIRGGSSGQSFRRWLAAATGIQFAQTDGEVVQELYEFGPYKFVITDKNVYRYGAEAEFLVEVGDVTVADTPLTDAVQIYDLNRGILPDWVQGISAGSEFLVYPAAGEVVFQNTVVDWQGTYDSEGNLKLYAELGGHPLAVEEFWDVVHARGLIGGTTLAEYLDVRPEDARETPPTLESVPATVNPAQFVVQQLLRFNTFIVKIKSEAVLGLDADILRSDLIRWMLPPEIYCIVIVDLPLIEGSGDSGSGETEVSDFTLEAEGASPVGSGASLLYEVAFCHQGW